MKLKNRKKVLVKSLILTILLILFSYMTANAASVRADSKNIEEIFSPGVGGIVSIFWGFIRVFLIMIVFIVELGIGILTSVFTKSLTLSIDGVIFGKLPLVNLEFLTNPAKAGLMFRGTVQIASSLSRMAFLTVIGAEFLILVAIIVKGIIENVTAPGKAKLKQGLLTWAKSLIILVGINFIGFVILHANKAIVAALESGISGIGASGGNTLESSIRNTLFSDLMNLTPSLRFEILLILYLVLKFQAVVMYIYYLKRALKILVQLLLAPVVAINSGIAGITGGKDGLSKWTTRFIGIVFMQSVHAFLYMTLVGTVMSFADSLHLGGNISALDALAQLIPIAIIMIGAFQFIFHADDYFEKYFHQGSDGEKIGASAGIAIAYAGKGMKQVAKGTKKLKEFNDKKITARAVDTKLKEPNVNVSPDSGAGSGKDKAKTKDKEDNNLRTDEKKEALKDKPKEVEEKKKEDLNLDSKENKGLLRNKLDKVLENAGLKEESYARKLLKPSAIKLRKLEEKQFKKKVKKNLRKKRDKMPVRLAKFVGKNTVRGVTYVAMQSTTKDHINARAVNHTTNAITGVAKEANKAIGQYKKVKAGLPEFKFKKLEPIANTKQRYYDHLEIHSDHLGNTAKRLQVLRNENLDINTSLGKENLEELLRILNAKQENGSLKKEFENAQKKLTEEFAEKFKVDMSTARSLVDELEKKVNEANILEIGELTDAEQDFITAVTENSLAEVMKNFNEDSKKLEDIIGLDKEYMEDKNYQDDLQLKHYNNVLNLLEYNEERRKEAESEEDAEEDDIDAIKEKVKKIPEKTVDISKVIEDIKKDWE